MRAFIDDDTDPLDFLDADQLDFEELVMLAVDREFDGRLDGEGDSDDYETESDADVDAIANAADEAASDDDDESESDEEASDESSEAEDAAVASTSAGIEKTKRKRDDVGDSSDSNSDDGGYSAYEDSEDEQSDDEDGSSSSSELMADENDDDTVKKIIASTKTNRSHPPDLRFDDFVVDLSFHPEEQLIAVGTMGGDVILTRYANELNEHQATIECHLKSVRDLQFSLDGATLLSASKDKTIALSDVQTGAMRFVYNAAHDEPLYTLAVIDENLFASGDESGEMKLWDMRQARPVFSVRPATDYVTQILTNSARKLLVMSSGDGFLSAVNIGSQKLYVQSEQYDEELTCMGLFRGESKLVVGSSKGRFYSFNWGEFGVHGNMFPGPKTPLSMMVPVTDRIAVTGGEDGIVRAMHMLPGRNLGVVGQHPLGVESMDISGDGELIASSSHDNDIKFWNIKYFEDIPDIKANEKHNKRREMRHNLPSSKQKNAGDFFADLNGEDEEED